MSGISTAGVPKSLKGSTIPFYYNDIKKVEKLIKEDNKIGAIKMEVQRNIKPEKNFLKKIKKFAKKMISY